MVSFGILFEEYNVCRAALPQIGRLLRDLKGFFRELEPLYF